MAHMSREANLVGACALAVAGRLPAGAADAALLSLSTWLAGGTVDRLSRAVGLTHSGAVRLADRLEGEGLLERRPGPDGRTRALHLTPTGLRVAGELQAERFAALEDVLGALDQTERAALADIAGKLLALITEGGASPAHTCRLCAPDVCGHPDRCPVTQAAR